MAFADYARSIPRAYPEVPSKKFKPKPKFYTYSSNGSRGIGLWEILNDVPDQFGIVECHSHHRDFTSNPYLLARSRLREISE